MGQPGMSDFITDDEWQKSIRDRLLKPFYETYSFEHRFVFADKGKLATTLQREIAVDTVAQKKENELVGVEEKIVRWPGYSYINFTLETMSCTTPGREKQGWMYTAQCDYLFYCFLQDGDNRVILYSIPFEKLKAWFFENNHYSQYKITVTKQINHTECRKVPIRDVMTAIPETKRFVIPPVVEEGGKT